MIIHHKCHFIRVKNAKNKSIMHTHADIHFNFPAAHPHLYPVSKLGMSFLPLRYGILFWTCVNLFRATMKFYLFWMLDGGLYITGLNRGRENEQREDEREIEGAKRGLKWVFSANTRPLTNLCICLKHPPISWYENCTNVFNE